MKSYGLFDADLLAYEIGLACETRVRGWGEDPTKPAVQVQVSPEGAIRKLNDRIEKLLDKMDCEIPIICLSDPEVNWRHSVLPSYKMNRSDSARPHYWKMLRDYLANEYKSYLKPTLEGDDVCGILATHPTLLEGRKVICSIDKDMMQISCEHYNWNQPQRKVFYVEPAWGEMYHYVQAMTGDVVDGYGGVPKIGEQTAYKLLLEADGEGIHPWQVVLDAYAEWGMTEEDALCIARVARICQYQDYDYNTKEVKLWETPLELPEKTSSPLENQ